eukprot:gene13063-12964_t
MVGEQDEIPRPAAVAALRAGGGGGGGEAQGRGTLLSPRGARRDPAQASPPIMTSALAALSSPPAPAPEPLGPDAAP